MKVSYLFLLLILCLLERAATSQTFIAKAIKSSELNLYSHQSALLFRGGGYYGDDDDHRRNDYHRGPETRRPRSKKKSSPSVLTSIAKSSLDLSKKAAVTTVQQSGKAAFYLIKPKAVDRDEILGVWRLDQQVSRDDDIQTCSANVELTRSGKVYVGSGGGDNNRDSSMSESYFQFSSKSWPQSCKIEFEARAFAVGDGRAPPNRRPQLFFYRGYFERKLADPSVIKMTGKIYRMVRGGWRGKGKLQYIPIGTFVGRRRVTLPVDDFQDQYDAQYDGEYDEEYDEETENEEVEEDYDYDNDDGYDEQEYH